MRTTRNVFLLLALFGLFSAGAVLADEVPSTLAEPVVAEQAAETEQAPAPMPEVSDLTRSAVDRYLTPVVWSRCIEPSPCQNHGDCDFPNGVCLTNFDYPEVPSPKVCHCL